MGLRLQHLSRLDYRLLSSCGECFVFFHASHASQDQSQGLRLQHFVKIMWCVLMDLYHLLLQLVTVFSAPNYCGEFDNAGGLLKVSENLTCSFSIVPVSRHSSLVPRPFSKGLSLRLQTLWLARLPPDAHCASKQTPWLARLPPDTHANR